MDAEKSGDRPHEDLLVDGTKFVRRLSLILALPNSLDFLTSAGQTLEVFWGVDRLGRSSIYVGDEWSVQWDENGALRRLYWGGANIAATQGQLEELIRQPAEDETQRVQLRRERLSEERASGLLTDCRDLLIGIQDRLLNGAYQIRGSIPSGEPVLEELTQHLGEQLISDKLRVAPSPS